MSQAHLSDGPYECAVERNVMVPAGDGTGLATDIYRPALSGKPVEGSFPVILERTPYGKHLGGGVEITAQDRTPWSRPQLAEYFASRGYVVALQDCRGRFASEGQFVKYLADGEDGYHTAAWLIAQPWCDGKIGTMGHSYATHNQIAMASLNAPGLACMVLDSGGHSDAYRSGIRQGGAFELKQATWAFKFGLENAITKGDDIAVKAMSETDIREWFHRFPWKKGLSPLTPVGEYEDYLFEQMSDEVFGENWKKVGLYAEGHYSKFPDIPMLCLSSWYDVHPLTIVDLYQAMTNRNSSSTRLIMGPWTHGARSSSEFGGVSFGAQASIEGVSGHDFRELRLNWFDHWLKGIDNGADKAPPVSIFTMGGGTGAKTDKGKLDHGGRWRSEVRWPPSNAKSQAFHLSSDGLLSVVPVSSDMARRSFTFDPRHPVPTIGGAVSSGEPVMRGGPFDQRESADFFGCQPPFLPLGSRSDILVFQTPVLDEDVEISGPVEADLWVSSDCPDTDFTIKLIDTYPPSEDYPLGFAMNLTDGILRMKARHRGKVSVMEAGKIYRITIEAFPTSNLFKAGHRIRLDISSSNFPRFDVNRNTGEPFGSQAWRIANNTVHMSEHHPSAIRLPVVRR